MLDFIHSGDTGDLIYGCAVMRTLGEGILYLSTQIGVRESMTQAKTASIRSLLEKQSYISSVLYNGEGDIHDFDRVHDFDDFRIYLGGKVNLLEAQAICVGAKPDYSPWLIAPTNSVNKIILHRSPRYHASTRWHWREIVDQHKGDCTFVGSPEEHRRIKQLVGRIDYRPTKTLLELAAIINCADYFIGNQSAPLAVALGLGKICAFERSPESPNCDFPVARLYSNPFDLWKYKQSIP